jgi:hypothetical protein
MEHFETESDDLLFLVGSADNGSDKEDRFVAERGSRTWEWRKPTASQSIFVVVLFIAVACFASWGSGSTNSQPLNDAERRRDAFSISVSRYLDRIGDTGTNFWSLAELHPDREYHLNIVRVPKAASSHLSLIARALVGCTPDGYPCCRGPSRSCPRDGLLCHSVIGCVDHRPNYIHSELPLLTTLRHPIERLLSGFFYSPPHRPKPKDDYTWSTFESYIKSAQYRNVMTKMFSTGEYAYHDFREEEHTVIKAQERLCHSTWFGINDAPLLSSLLLYETNTLADIQPNPAVFEVQGIGDYNFSTETASTNDGGMRRDSNPLYHTFENETFPQNDGPSLVSEYNQQDLLLYEWATGLFCARVREAGLFDIAAKEVAPDEVRACRKQTMTRTRDFCL